MNNAPGHELGLLRTDLEQLRGQLTSLDTRLARLEAKSGETEAEPSSRRREILQTLSDAPKPAVPPPLPMAAPKPAAKPAPIPAGTASPIVKAAAPQPEKKQTATPQSAPGPRPLNETVAPPPASAISRKESEEPKEGSSFEFELGSYWFVRVGVVMLLTGVGFLAKLAYTNWIVHAGPVGKVAGLYVIGGILLGAGAWLQRGRESLRNYAQVLFAGGLASVYFTTYAAHYFEPLRVISNEFIAGALLLAWAGFTAWLADRRKSEVMALFAIGLAYYTSGVNETGAFTLFSNLALSLAAVWFLVRNRWAVLSFVSLAGTYGGWAFWRFHHHGAEIWRSGVLEAWDFWLGAGFLFSYWTVFTVAVFVSRSGEFDRGNRAFFLTANNALLVLFGAFTTNLAYPDTFWAFPLTIGAVLLGLSVVANRSLPDEPTAENSYLVQGLLLVTWGIMAWFTGAQLALSLGIESVILILLGHTRRSVLMTVGGHLTAILAVLLALDDIRPFNGSGLALGIALGLLMLFNAWWLNRIRLGSSARSGEGGSETEKQPASPPVPVEEGSVAFFSLAGLIPWFVATLQNLEEQAWAPVLALTGIAVILSIEKLRVRALSLFGLGYLACAQGSSFKALATLPPAPLLNPAVVIAATLTTLVWHERRNRLRIDGDLERTTIGWYSLAICALLGLATIRHLDPAWRGPALAAEAALLALAHRGLPLRTLSHLGSVFLLGAEAIGYAMAHARPDLPLWSPMATAAFSLPMLLWWQRQTTLPMYDDWRKTLPALGSAGVVGLFHVALDGHFQPETWLAVSALLAVLFGLAGGVARLWPLAVAGQFFLLESIWEFHKQLLFGHPAWWAALVPVLVLGGYALAGSEWKHRFGGAAIKLAETLTPAVVLARVGAVILGTLYVIEYFDTQWRLLVLATVGTAVFLRGAFDKVPGRAETGSAFIGTGLLLFWANGLDKDHAGAANLIAIVMLMGRHLLTARFRELFPLTRNHHTVIILTGGATLWLWSTRAALNVQNGFLLTVAWALLAFLLTGIGFLIREREYRRLGIAILALALGRVFLVDVWQLSQGFRVLSFMGLGLALIALGYLYNRFQEQVREWI